MVKRFFCILTALLLLLPLVPALGEPGVYNWYEVFVRSFQDSDGDGIGDLQGLISRLDYLEDMGYEGLWLMPVMPSPSYHKYDVTDYMDIDPEYGTLDDMRQLVQEMHSRGMRLIIDLPLNHTSTRHPWFLAAVEALKNDAVSPYISYYHFTRTPGGVPLKDTGWYYEEQFSGGNMPDLALENAAVVQEIRQILAFWLTDVGLDGFRLDTVSNFFTGDTEANVAFLAKFNEMCQEIKPGCFLVGECWMGLSTIADYYKSGVDSFFLFPASQAEGFIVTSLRGRGATHAEKFAKAYQNVLDTIGQGTLAPFLSNHDTGRTIGSVQGRSNLPLAKFVEGVLNMLQGCVFTYYGEEIGMVGSGEDANKRLAMYWSDEDMTDQPPGVTNLEYAYPSVAAQQADADSLLHYCRMVSNARKQVPAIARGENEFVLAEGEVCIMRRTLGEDSVLIAMNFSAKETQHCAIQGEARVLFDLETGREAAALTAGTLTLPPYAIVILKEESASADGAFSLLQEDAMNGVFYLGMDVSSVLSLENSGVVYRDAAGNPRDLFALLAENGVNLIRVRVWNDPYDSEGHGYGGGNCDISTAVEIGRWATAAGMRLLVDFHYSDFWADPSKQMVPKAWVDVSSRQKAGVLRKWTEECLGQLRDAGVDVAMVQIGNETNGWLCGETNWNKICQLMKAGSAAVRTVFPEALVAVHFTNPEDTDTFRTYARKLDDQQVDYDVFGSSYYPFWHGTLDNLKAVLSEVVQTYGKRVMVLETSYPWTLEDGDWGGNSIGPEYASVLSYPVSVQGQISEVTDVIAAMQEIGGIGVCYWEGAWVPVGRSSRAENAAKWETFGSGWASSYSAEYDPDDAGRYYGGSVCDNQTLFDFDGRALPSLGVFRMAEQGLRNLLKNGFFEEDDVSMWRCRDLNRTADLWREDGAADSLSGHRHWHFYSPEAGSVCFELEQDVSGLPAGKYDFSISVMGDSAGTQEIYSYVKLNGETRWTQPAWSNGWGAWCTPEIRGFDVSSGDTVTVGIHVRCDGAGAWGKIDNAALLRVGE